MNVFHSDILKGKPASVISVVSSATYDHICTAIQSNDTINETLAQVISMCKANPNDVLCVVYKSFEDSVLLVYGTQPFCVQLEGSKLQELMMNQSRENHIYVFTYVKSSVGI